MIILSHTVMALSHIMMLVLLKLVMALSDTVMALSHIMILVLLKLVMALSHTDGIESHHDAGAIKVSDGIK